MEPNIFHSSDQLEPTVQNCVDCYTSDWVVVSRKYQQYSSSIYFRYKKNPAKAKVITLCTSGTGERRNYKLSEIQRDNSLRWMTHQTRHQSLSRFVLDTCKNIA